MSPVAGAPSVGIVPDGAAEGRPFLDTPSEEWLAPPEISARRAAAGLGVPQVSSFVDSCEFIGLGNFCAVTRALQALGLKKYAYPFDWTRSPLSGIIHLFDTNFEDFLTFTLSKDGGDTNEKFTYMQARWGGSFWHHEPELPKAREDFTRRIARLLGLQADVAAAMPRAFVRAVNSTRELDLTLKLFAVLKQALPSARIYLLMIIDDQDVEETLCIPNVAGLDVLFFKIRAHIFEDHYHNFSMKACSESYARAIACAIRIWSRAGLVAGQVSPRSSTDTPAHLQDLAQVSAACDQFDGGNAGSEGFWPRRFKGQRICLPRFAPAAQFPRLFSSNPPSGGRPGASPPTGSAEAEGAQQAFDVKIPVGVRQGDILRTEAFGFKDVQVEVPGGAQAGQTLRLRLVGQTITSTLLAAAATATATAATAATLSEQAGLAHRMQAGHLGPRSLDWNSATHHSMNHPAVS